MRAKERLRDLWQPGDLFHAFARYPRRTDAKKVDRLAGILSHGIVAPASCDDGSVASDLHIVATGFAVPYDSLVFLHRLGSRSGIYTISQPGRIAVFVDPKIPVLTQEDMGRDWVILCQDEVYVRDRIAVEHLIGVAVHPADADSVKDAYLSDFQRLGIPLYLDDGTPIWPQT